MNRFFSLGHRAIFASLILLMVSACGSGGPDRQISAAQAGYSVSVSIIDSNGRPVKTLGLEQSVRVVVTIMQGSRPATYLEIDALSDIGVLDPYSGIATTNDQGRAVYGFEAGSEVESGFIEISFGTDEGEVVHTTAIQVSGRSK